MSNEVILADPIFLEASNVDPETVYAGTIEVGTVTTVAPGEDATVVNSGTVHAAVFDFEIPQGAKGDPGDTGNGIASIELTETVGLVKTYTVTYTDATTMTFDVEDGADGHSPVITFVGTVIYVDGVAGPDLRGEKGDKGDAGMISVISITLIDDSTVLATGDAQGSLFIPEEYDGYYIVKVVAALTTPSSSGLPTFQTRINAVDILTTLLTIDETETSSLTATTAAVIDYTKNQVATGDTVFFDCDVSGTGAKGAKVLVYLDSVNPS